MVACKKYIQKYTKQWQLHKSFIGSLRELYSIRENESNDRHY